MPMASGQRMRLRDLAPEVGVEGLGVVLDWVTAEDAEDDQRPDVDASALVLDEQGLGLSDEHFVFYNNPDPGDGSVWLATVGESDEAQFQVGAELEERVARVVFALSIHEADARNQDLSMVEGPHVRLSDEASGTDLLCYGFPKGQRHSTSLTLGELYRDDQGDWGFHAVSRGYANGLAEVAEAHGVNVRGETDAEENVDPTPATYAWTVDTVPPDTITPASVSFLIVT
jgi:serine/threonine-protein kinase